MLDRKTILFVSKSEHTPSTRYRALSYFDMLRNQGWNPIHQTLHGSFSRLKLLQSARKANVTVVLRKTFSASYLFLLRRFSRNLVFDLDDAIFIRSNGGSSNRRKTRFAELVRHCGQVWAGNSYLADMARRFSDSVFEVPTSIDPKKYAPDFTKPTNVFDLVWIGSSSTRKYLAQALPALEKMTADIPFLRLKIIADFDLPTRRLMTLAVPWSETGEAEALGSAHIGIAPMPDDPWTQGKCGLKVLQYMAAGLPVVSSPTGVNKDIVIHGETGFLASTDEEWRKAIEKLINNAELRKKMGQAGRKRMMEHYALDRTFLKITNHLDMLFKDDPRTTPKS